jgi:DNA replication protein DnaC
MEKIKVDTFLAIDLDGFINQSFKDLSSNELVKKEFERLKVNEKEIKENISAFLTFQDDINYCKNCPGLDLCEKKQRHYNIKIERSGRFLSRTFTPCPKLMKKIDEDNFYLETDFPESWRQSSFSLISARQSRADFIKEAINIVQKSSHRWLYLIGSHKTGKSFLLATFLNEMVGAKKGPVAFINTSTKFKYLLDISINNKNAFKKEFDLLCEVPVLVLDDFGNEFKSEFMRDQVLFPLLSTRSKNNLITCFTSDFKIEEIVDLYSRISPLRAKQIGTLLKDMCLSEIVIEGVPNLY